MKDITIYFFFFIITVTVGDGLYVVTSASMTRTDDNVIHYDRRPVSRRSVSSFLRPLCTTAAGRNSGGGGDDGDLWHSTALFHSSRCIAARLAQLRSAVIVRSSVRSSSSRHRPVSQPSLSALRPHVLRHEPWFRATVSGRRWLRCPWPWPWSSRPRQTRPPPPPPLPSRPTTTWCTISGKTVPRTSGSASATWRWCWRRPTACSRSCTWLANNFSARNWAATPRSNTSRRAAIVLASSATTTGTGRLPKSQYTQPYRSGTTRVESKSLPLFFKR